MRVKETRITRSHGFTAHSIVEHRIIEIADGSALSSDQEQVADNAELHDWQPE